ncbi:uncharacterized protein [Leptinotarsa decemlineata]|uniref:uncharacterized protein n=1 Tax=Leptinotarsa decemlineata TaxID=7539 RepID=UPI003D30827D
MASNTQEINNVVASIMPVVKEKAATSSGRGRSLSPELFEADRVSKKVSRQPTVRSVIKEKAATSSGRGRSLSPDLFEDEDRVVKKVCRQPAARSGPIEKYRVACNRTNPYAGSWPNARKSLRSSTPPAGVVKTRRAPSPEEPVVLTPLAVPLSSLPATPANPQVLVPQVPVRQLIGEVSKMLSGFLERCKEAERASRSSEAALASISRR